MKPNMKHIILDRVRVSLNLLKKSNFVTKSNNNSENAIPYILKELQDLLRWQQSDFHVKSVILPFLSMLRSKNISGPYIRSAIETIQVFIHVQIFDGSIEDVSDSLSDIVDAIINCKFVQTDAVGDEIVYYSLLETLRLLIENSCSAYLQSSVIWKIFEFNTNILCNKGLGQTGAFLMYQCAERSVRSVIKCLISKVASNIKGKDKSIEEMDVDKDVDGVACLCDVLEYFIQIIRKRAELFTTPPTASPSKNGHHQQQQSNQLSYNINKSSPQSSSTLLQAYLLDEVSNDSDVLHLLLSLKEISAMLTTGGNLDIIHKVLGRSKRFYALFTDELGLSLLLLCNVRESYAYPSTVFQSVLNLFSVLINTIGPCMRIVLECFIRQVVLKALIQTYSFFSYQVNTIGTTSPFIMKTAFLNAAVGSNASKDFRLEELELIFEMLCDVLSDATILPSLFVSFDCHPTSVDIVRPLVNHICRCSSLALSFSSELMVGQLKEISILIVQMFTQVMKTVTMRYQATGRTKTDSEGRPKQQSLEHDEVIDGTSSASSSGGSISVDVSKELVLAQIVKSSRITKCLLLQASELFEAKPEKGLKYLQSFGALPTPLTPQSVAKFLRIAPELRKETTGAFLGELGKDNSSYEANSKEFHSLLLVKYVESFEFTNYSVLDCMRIFLSAFRLPGEAQQIDRILEAFSDRCFRQSHEGNNGIIQNAEITYLLTFSIIMLNTDRHNPNIKAERRMTKEQFVRNNRNYGKDYHQTIDLPQEYLEGIFSSIDDFPIRTDGHELAGSFNIEIWKDLQMQAKVDFRKSILVSFQPVGNLLHELKSGKAESIDSMIEEFCHNNYQDSSNNNNNAAAATTSPELSVTFISRKLLIVESGGGVEADEIDPIELSLELRGFDWIFEEDIFRCIWFDLLRVCVCIHVQRYLDMKVEKGSTLLKHKQLRKLLAISNEFLQDLLSISTSIGLDVVMNVTVLTLTMCSGMITTSLQNKLKELLGWDTDPLYVAVVSELEGIITEHDTMIHQFRHFDSAVSSATTLLSVIQTYQSTLSDWSIVWYFLGGLRDCSLIPKELIVEREADLLPPNIRLDFENKLIDIDKTVFEQTCPKQPKKIRKSSSSLLSLQGLGEALFGSDDRGAQDADKSADDGSGSDGSFNGSTDSYNRDLSEFHTLFKLNAVSVRWDAGYEGGGMSSSTQPREGNDVDDKSEKNKGSSNVTVSEQFQTLDENSIPPYSVLDGGLSVEDLRSEIGSSGIIQLVSDSRFLSEAVLQQFLKSLISVIEVKEDMLTVVGNTNESINSSDVMMTVTGVTGLSGRQHQQALDSVEFINSKYVEFFSQCRQSLNSRFSFSSSTIAWLEMILVDVSLRNRDRFNIIWPILKHHYLKVLSGSYVKLSYISERRIVGLMKICTRMLSREHYSGEILEVMGKVFARTTHSDHHVSIASTDLESKLISSIDANLPLASKQQTFHPMSNSLLLHFSSQIASSMWNVLTLNVELLPLLPLEQWQTLFTILAICGAASGFAAIKTFESMAWLLHEPRLLAKVPVFCIIGVKPLLRNTDAPLSVSIGAVHLLTHLHSRLEVLIKDDIDDYVECELCDDVSNDGDTPVLWESCWTPILKALLDGVDDKRSEVRESCAEALCQAILDRHASAAPAGVLMSILGGIVSPMIIRLRDHVVKAINQALPPDVHDKFLTSEQIHDVLQQQWVKVEAPAIATEVAEGESHVVMVDPTTFETSSSTKTSSSIALESLLTFDNGTVSVLMECLSALCKSLLHHMKKLSTYPSFDKLWFCILNVLGHFLSFNGSQSDTIYTEISNIWDKISIDIKNQVKDLYAMNRASKDHLQRMLQAMTKDGVFDLRPGLITVTIETIKQFSGCEDLIEPLSLSLKNQ